MLLRISGAAVSGTAVRARFILAKPSAFAVVGLVAPVLQYTVNNVCVRREKPVR